MISAFISNTVTAAMMLAIVSGILGAVEDAAGQGRRPAVGFATGLFLCIAFAASIGGLATPIGTPTNLIGLGFIREQLGVAVSFAGWCAVSLPTVVILTAILVAVLARLFPAGVERLEGVSEFVRAERRRLGAWTIGQKSTALAFGITVVLWVVPGLVLVALGPDHPASEWLRKRMPEGVAALIGAILLFLLPGDRRADGYRPRAVVWGEARIDWDIVLLYGGGLALGELCFSTGLASAAGQGITGWIPTGPWAGTVLVIVAAVVAVVTSEFTSNVASATMVVPIVIALGQAVGAEPVAAALAATFAASLGFMMPVSSPCNAIVYGSGRIPLRAMMAAGGILDVIGTVVITAIVLAVTRAWL
jgi:sodium-dependent dicarboxylate transporter 2/3/5